jgi:hypothetical protein
VRPTGNQGWRAAAAIGVLVAGASACSAGISPYSAAAYQQATSLRAEALSVMGKATEPYAEHEQEAQALQLEVEKAYEFARGRPNNEISTKQWEILMDPGRNLLGGFLKRWKEESTLSAAFIVRAKDLVGDAFDTIIGLESGKIKPNDVQG